MLEENGRHANKVCGLRFCKIYNKKGNIVAEKNIIIKFIGFSMQHENTKYICNVSLASFHQDICSIASLQAGQK